MTGARRDAWGRLSKNVVPVLEECKTDKSYQNRSTLLLGAAEFGPLLSPEEMQTLLCPAVLEMCDDKVRRPCTQTALRPRARHRAPSCGQPSPPAPHHPTFALPLAQVPNLRIEAMKSMSAVSKCVTADYKTSKIVPKLNEKLTDEDPDVVHFAKLAMKTAESC